MATTASATSGATVRAASPQSRGRISFGCFAPSSTPRTVRRRGSRSVASAAVAAARALVLTQPRRLESREFPLPDVGPDDGVLRVDACGLCGTDHEQFTGELWGGFAFVPGHEIVGTIEAVGDAAAARWGGAPGDGVAVEVFQSCRNCDACRAGEYRRCARHGLRDMYGFVDVAT